MKQIILPCPFCRSENVYADSRRTSGNGSTDNYASQVRCRKCLARGPAVKFKAEIKPNWPDLDWTNPDSAISVAESAAIDHWDRAICRSNTET